MFENTNNYVFRNYLLITKILYLIKRYYCINIYMYIFIVYIIVIYRNYYSNPYIDRGIS